jgi:hypothetical protein
MRGFRSDVVLEERERRTPALAIIVSMSPPSYPSAWLHPCRARFRFTWHDHCNPSPLKSGGFCCVMFAAC